LSCHGIERIAHHTLLEESEDTLNEEKLFNAVEGYMVVQVQQVNLIMNLWQCRLYQSHLLAY
jgi:hypothetical protein